MELAKYQSQIIMVQNQVYNENYKRRRKHELEIIEAERVAVMEKINIDLIEKEELQKMSDMQMREKVQAIIKLIWPLFDKDNSGALNVDETMEFMITFGLKYGFTTRHDFNREKFKQFFIQYDTNRDDLLERDEAEEFIIELLKIDTHIWVEVFIQEGEVVSEDSDAGQE